MKPQEVTGQLIVTVIFYCCQRGWLKSKAMAFLGGPLLGLKLCYNNDINLF